MTKRADRKRATKKERVEQEMRSATESLRERLEKRLRADLSKLREDLSSVLDETLWQPEKRGQTAHRSEPNLAEGLVCWQPEESSGSFGSFCVDQEEWGGPPTATIGEALDLVDAEATRLVQDEVATAATAVQLLATRADLAPAMLARGWLPERWAWPSWTLLATPDRASVVGPDWSPHWLIAAMLRARTFGARLGPDGTLIGSTPEGPVLLGSKPVPTAILLEALPRLPAEVSSLDVWEYAKQAWGREGPTMTGIAGSREQTPDGPFELVYFDFQTEAGKGRFSGFNVGLFLFAEREVERDRSRPTMALDAGRPHADLVAGWREVPKDIRKPHTFREPYHGKVELLAPGRCVQLSLALTESTGEAVAKNLKAWRGAMGLRHWAALQRLWSVEGGRSGEVLWTLDAHFEALGYSRSERTRARLRASVAEQVRFLTQLELAVYDSTGQIRERRPLVIRLSETDELTPDGAWLTSGMRLKVNPLLYDGVRTKDGVLGSNWHPAPAELAQVDHQRNPYTLTLGLVLPIRWRLELNRNGKGFVALSGQNLLEMAGISYQPRAPGKAWSSLERDLIELHRIGGVGRWDWDGATPSLARVCRIYPADWAADRTLRGVRPIETVGGPQVLTGDALRDWRKARGLSQGALANQLMVSQDKVSRLERRGAQLLPLAFATQLRGLAASYAESWASRCGLRRIVGISMRVTQNRGHLDAGICITN